VILSLSIHFLSSQFWGPSKKLLPMYLSSVSELLTFCVPILLSIRRHIDCLKEEVKVKVSSYTPWRRTGGERRYSSCLYLTSATRWGWVVSVTPWPRFTPGERTPGTHWIGGWVGPRAGLDAGDRRKILCPCWGLNLNHPIVQPIVRHYTAWATAAPV
jgi:hypothetical protein